MNTLAFSTASAQASSAPVSSASAAPFRIAAGAVLTLRQGRDLTVEVIEGRLWITSAGDGADHFVGPAGCHPLGRARVVVIENVGRASALLRLTRG